MHFAPSRIVEENLDPAHESKRFMRQGQIKAVGRVLEQFYPGHPWRVEMPDDASIVKIQLQGLMGPSNWMVIHTNSLKGEEGMALVKRMAGEILERFQIARLGFSANDFRAAMAAVPLHKRFHGHVPG